MKIVIRVDAAKHIGYGHVMRCLSLADGLRRWGNDAIFICRELPGDRIELLKSRDYTVYSFIEGDDSEQSVKILNDITPVDTLIVDHYGLDKSWEEKIRPIVSQLVVLDDLADRPHDSDLLIDPSLGREKSDYQTLVPAHSQLLLGPSYALLSESYSWLRYSSLARRHHTTSLNRILVSMGGADPANATSMIIDALSCLEKPLLIDVVASFEWEQLGIIQQKIEQSRHKIQLHRNITNLAALIDLADLAIGAGGITSYERCCLGLPTIVLTIADNQYHNAAALHRKKAVISLGRASVVGIDMIANAVNELIGKPLQWQCMSNAAATICDGYGVNRIISHLLSGKNALWLRPATFSDSEVMFEWQQDPSTRQYARNPEVPSRTEHKQWLEHRLNSPDCLFNMMMLGEEPVGVLRFDRLPNNDNAVEVSIVVSPLHRKKGLAASALNLSRKLFSNLDFYAEVHSKNKASHQLFLSTGYIFKGTGYFNRRLTFEH